jgi:hypothetical protein
MLFGRRRTPLIVSGSLPILETEASKVLETDESSLYDASSTPSSGGKEWS